MRGRRLRFYYRPSKFGRAASYVVVLVGFVAWLISGDWREPADAGDAQALPVWTLLFSVIAYFVFAFVEKFGLEDDDN